MSINNRVRALLLALTLGLICWMAADVAPAGASTQHAPPVPSCPGFGRISSGTHAWFDYHDPTAGLVPNMNRLICSAAYGSTIDIKSWFLYDDGPYVQQTMHDLWIMAKYHRVRVNLAVSDRTLPNGGSGLKRLGHPLKFLHVYPCPGACNGTGTHTAASHAKWLTVSSLRRSSGGGHAVLSMSMNFSSEQYAQGQSGILTVRKAGIYHTFTSRFASYMRCSRGTCDRRVPTGAWAGNVWLMPSLQDPELLALQHVDCRRGGVIELMSINLLRTSVARWLERDRLAGCRVYVLLEAPTLTLAGTGIRPRCVFSHDKMLLIATPHQQEVIQGSQDASPSEVSAWDNQMVRAFGPRITSAFRSYFWREYTLHGRYRARNC